MTQIAFIAFIAAIGAALAIDACAAEALRRRPARMKPRARTPEDRARLGQ